MAVDNEEKGKRIVKEGALVVVTGVFFCRKNNIDDYYYFPRFHYSHMHCFYLVFEDFWLISYKVYLS